MGYPQVTRPQYNRIIVIFLIATCVTGCTATLSLIRFENRERLSKLSLGMTKQAVLKIMGTKPVRAHDNWGDVIGIINNPYKEETLIGEEKTLEALYYYTHIRHSDAMITEDELTPIVFEDGKLIGYGWDFFEYIRKKYKIKARKGAA